MSHLSTPLSSPSSVSASQRLPCRATFECAPGISATEQCHFTLHSIPFSPCHAPQQHFVYRTTTAFWTDGKMSWNANGLLILLWQASPCQSNNIYSAVPVLSKSFRQTCGWAHLRPARCWHIINKKHTLFTVVADIVLIRGQPRWLKLHVCGNKNGIMITGLREPHCCDLIRFHLILPRHSRCIFSRDNKQKLLILKFTHKQNHLKTI